MRESGCLGPRPKLNLPKLLRMFGRLVGVESPDNLQVSLWVLAGPQEWPEADLFTPVIEEAEEDGRFGCAGDVIEATFPVVNPAARTLRRNAEDEFIAPAEFLDGLFDHVEVGRTVNGDPPQGGKEPAIRKAKEGVLGHPVGAHPYRSNEDHAEYKIPVGGVGRADDHEFWNVRQNAHRSPAE